MKETLYFGLDIGTRTVVGIVGYKEGNQFVVVDYESRAHEERAMMDGQIHDIQKVSKVVYDVKHSLEKRLNISLKEVAIAAAGRSLRTQIVDVKQNYEEIQEFEQMHIHHLELQGVEEAKNIQESKDNATEYFCVAYSVIQYYLDDYIIANLDGHKGQSIGAKIIATFLPKQVIDSLYSVTERADLAVGHLTLEPIAAINAVIPEQIRLLNLALVDVGAGTSDIAITKEGSVVAYGMIPIAGDEVTETIIHNYLVDFDTAETIKIKSTISDNITFKDIMGISQTVTSEEVRDIIKPVMEKIGLEVSNKIKELNGENSPNAVFCVGGGSQMSDFTNILARNLSLLEQRVGVKTASQLINIKDNIGLIDSPEIITPVGICLTSIQNKYSQFTVIDLNGSKVQLLNAKKLKIIDALVQSGIEHESIFPRKGETLMFKLNGERQRIKGENGTPAVITLNDNEATLQDIIRDGDRINIKWGTPGHNGELIVGDIVKDTIQVQIEDEQIKLPIVTSKNNVLPLEYKIMNGDEIEIKEISTAYELLDCLGLNTEDKIIMIDFNAIDKDYILKDGDTILINEVATKKDEVQVDKKIDKEINEEIHKDRYKECNDTVINNNDNLYIIVNNDTIKLPKKQGGYVFASIFDFIDFDLSKPQGIIQLERNGEPGALTDAIDDGDVLKVYWKR